MALTLLLGGARSGKSSAAVRRGRRHEGPVVMIATGQVRDPEMAARVARHQTERPAAWITMETPVNLTDALRTAPDDALVIVDCLTLWVSNLMERDAGEDDIEARAAAAARVAAQRAAPTIAVSNEVGMGVVPTYELGRRYRDMLGRVNATWVGLASEAYLLVAGGFLPLVPGWGSDDPS